MRIMPYFMTVLALAPCLVAQQPDSTYAPVLRPGQRVTSAWTSAKPANRDSLRVDRYLYLGRRDEHLTIALNAGFGGFLVVVLDVKGKLEPIAGSDSIRAVSTLELKLPSEGRYYIIAGAKSLGSYTLVAQSMGSVSEMDWATLYPGGGDPAERYALLVGVNDYPGEKNDLRGGPLVDVDLMRGLLITKFGFRPANVLVLRDLEGNREQVIQAFRRHLGQAGPRGAALFYYSGHGIQLRENRGDPAGVADKETDDRDEALALWGSQGDLYGYLLDDEVGVLIDELRTDRILMILDDCHSGTATRGGEAASWNALMGGRLRVPETIRKMAGAIPPPSQSKRIERSDVASALENPMARLAPRGDAKSRDPVVLSASGDSESALGIGVTLDDGNTIQVGLFTLTLYGTILQSPATLTFESLLAKVGPLVTERAMKIAGTPQTPQISGKALRQGIARFLAKPER